VVFQRCLIYSLARRIIK